MKKSIELFIIAICFASAGFFSASASSCSNANLTKCLDSACSGNLGLNPAIRCQLCGTSQAGSPENNGIKKLSIGTSSRNTLSDQELKSAPTDPGQRYAWASAECIKKISGCDADDVSDTYDKLISQSCTAAGINADMKVLSSAINKTKSIDICTSEIQVCVTDTKHCGTNFSECKQDTDFNKFFSACASDATGCNDHIGTVRANLINQRNSAINNREKTISSIIYAYQTKRKNDLKSATANCQNNKSREACIKTVCQNNMINKCAPGFESEKSMATLLCKYYDTACERLK